MPSVYLTLYMCMFVSMNQSCWNTQYIPALTFLCWYAKAASFQHTQTKSSHRAQDMRFILLMFKYFDETLCTLVMLERPAQSLAYFFMIDCGGEKRKKKKKKINGCELERKWVNASETRDVEFRCMVTDGKPCRNQKIVFTFLWFCSRNIRCKWNPYYRMDGLRNKDKHCFKFAFPHTIFCEMSIADCFTCLCSAHSFLRDGNYRGADSKQSSVKM